MTGSQHAYRWLIFWQFLLHSFHTHQQYREQPGAGLEQQGFRDFGLCYGSPPPPPPPPWPWPRDFCKKLTLSEEHLISHMNLEGRLHNCLLSLASACKSSSLFHLRINSTHMQMINTRVWPALGSAAGQQAGRHLAREFSAPAFNSAGLSCSHFGYRKGM